MTHLAVDRTSIQVFPTKSLLLPYKLAMAGWQCILDTPFHWPDECEFRIVERAVRPGILHIPLFSEKNTLGCRSDGHNCWQKSCHWHQSRETSAHFESLLFIEPDTWHLQRQVYVFLPPGTFPWEHPGHIPKSSKDTSRLALACSEPTA